MTLRSSDLQSDSDLDSIRNSCDVFYDKSKTFAGEAMHEKKQGRNTALQVYASKFSIHFTMGDYTLEILYHWTLEIL